MHKILQDQLKHALGLGESAALERLLVAAGRIAVQPGMDPAVAALLANLGALLERVDAAYVQADRDLELRTRSLEISSTELTSANARLRQDIDERNRAVESLRATVSELLGSDELGGVGDADELASLSRIVANLVQEREKQRAQLDNIRFALDQHAIVSITDTQGTIIYANDKFCRISGYARAELLGRNHRIVKSGRHPDSLYAEMWETIAAGRTWHGEICNRARQGMEYWVAATIVPFLDEFGLPFEYIAIRTDITARKQAEADLMHARDIAEAASRAKGEFLANVSHEIRTPMNGIIGMTDLVLDSPLDVEQREYLQIVKSSADALLTLINDILDFSKIEAGKLTVECIEFDLRQVFGETLAPLRLRAGQKGLRFGIEIDAAVPTRVAGDPVRLRQVLVNLVGNAVKFTERGAIAVEVRVDANPNRTATLQVTVRDSGIGIPDDKLAQVFEAFSQADSSTTRKYGGTGLGLTISNRLVELMGGSMEVASTLGEGSVFCFSLPLGMPDSRPPAPADAAEASRQAATVRALSVLLVEDNPVNQMVATRMLEKWGHWVSLAQNGREAFDRLADRRFDLVLMDMQMPVMGGVDATRLIRRREDNIGLPRQRIVAMTANAMAEDRDACLAAGMDDYLAKPITAAALAAKLEAAGAQERRTLSVASPDFDYARALAEMDADILTLVTPVFLDSYSREVEGLAHAIAADDVERAGHGAHALKGTLAVFGADPAQRRAGEIEMLVRGGQISAAADLLAGLRQEIETLAGVLRARHEGAGR